MYAGVQHNLQMMFVSFKNNMLNSNSGAGTAYFFIAPEFTRGF